MVLLELKKQETLENQEHKTVLILTYTKRMNREGKKAAIAMTLQRPLVPKDQILPLGAPGPIIT